MHVAAAAGILPLVELTLQKANDSLDGYTGPRFQFIEGLVLALQRCQVALVDQFFLGADIVVEAGLGEAEARGDILQCRCPGALAVEEAGGLGEDRGALGVVLRLPVEGLGARGGWLAATHAAPALLPQWLDSKVGNSNFKYFICSCLGTVSAGPGKPGSQATTFLVAETVDEVVIDHADSLHEGIADGRADKGKTATLQLPAELPGQGRFCGNVLVPLPAVLQRLAVDLVPEEPREPGPALRQRDGRAGIGHHRLDLELVANDVSARPCRCQVRIGPAGQPLPVEPLEDPAVTLPLAQDCQPGQASLRTLEVQELEEPAFIGNRHAPLLVVVGPVVCVVAAPGAARLMGTVLPWHSAAPPWRPPGPCARIPAPGEEGICQRRSRSALKTM